jgi:hypothetical protein
VGTTEAAGPIELMVVDSMGGVMLAIGPKPKLRAKLGGGPNDGGLRR